MRPAKEGVVHVNSKTLNALSINNEFILFMKLLRVFGIIPLKFAPTASGRWILARSWLLRAYSCVLILIVVLVPAYTIHEEFTLGKPASRADKLVKILEYASMAAYLGSVLLTMHVRTKNLMEYFSFMSQITENFEVPSFLKPADRRLLITNIVGIVFGILIDLQDLYDDILDLPHIMIQVIVLNMPYTLLFHLCALATGNLVVFMWSIESRSAAVVEELRKLMDEDIVATRDDREGLLHRLQSLQTHQIRLRHCANCINSGFGLPILWFLLFMLLQSIIAIYYLIIDLNGKGVRTFLLNLQWTIYLLFWNLMFVEPCHRYTRKDGLMTDLIITILIKIRKSDELAVGSRQEPRTEILWAQEMILHTTVVKITAFGITTVDRSLLGAFASFITTFLVILLQFNEQEIQDS